MLHLYAALAEKERRRRIDLLPPAGRSAVASASRTATLGATCSLWKIAERQLLTEAV
jgi:hypothetical protein